MRRRELEHCAVALVVVDCEKAMRDYAASLYPGTEEGRGDQQNGAFFLLK